MKSRGKNVKSAFQKKMEIKKMKIKKMKREIKENQ
jgi:hypothetical protein